MAASHWLNRLLPLAANIIIYSTFFYSVEIRYRGNYLKEQIQSGQSEKETTRMNASASTQFNRDYIMASFLRYLFHNGRPGKCYGLNSVSPSVVAMTPPPTCLLVGPLGK